MTCAWLASDNQSVYNPYRLQGDCPWLKPNETRKKGGERIAYRPYKLLRDERTQFQIARCCANGKSCRDSRNLVIMATLGEPCIRYRASCRTIRTCNQPETRRTAPQWPSCTSSLLRQWTHRSVSPHESSKRKKGWRLVKSCPVGRVARAIQCQTLHLVFT